MQPTIRYTKSGPVHVAYQVFGDGAIDLVLVPGFISHLEVWWSEPAHVRWLNRLGQSARVILFDKRGTGLSDRVDQQPDMDARMDDVRAVESSARPSWEFQRPVHLLHCLPPRTRNAVRHLYFTAPSRAFPPGFRPKQRCSNSITTPTQVGAPARACRCSCHPWLAIRPFKSGGPGLSGLVQLPPLASRSCG